MQVMGKRSRPIMGIKDYRNKIVMIDYYTPQTAGIHNPDPVNILSPIYRLKRYRFLRPPSPYKKKDASGTDKSGHSSTSTLLGPKPSGYVPTTDSLFEVPMLPAPKSLKLSRKRRLQAEQSEHYTTALMQAIAANVISQAGRNFTRHLQAIVPTEGVSSVQYAALVQMEMPSGNSKPVPNSKFVIRKGPAPFTNILTRNLPLKAQKAAEDGFQFAFVWADGGTWKTVSLKNNEKPRYKFYTKRAMRFRVGRRMPTILEKNEDEHTLNLDEWTLHYHELQRKRHLDQLMWDKMEPEGNAKILEGTPKLGRARQLPQCPFHMRLYCTRRHTWLLRDFRSCPLCDNTYTVL